MTSILTNFFDKKYWTNEQVAIRKKHIHKKIELFPHTVPVIIKSKELKMHSEKLMIPKCINMIDFQNIIRRKSKLTEFEAIFLFVNGTTIVKATDVINEVYTAYKKEDDILYVVVSKENTFGK
jgi:hypothetical protein